MSLPRAAHTISRYIYEARYPSVGKRHANPAMRIRLGFLLLALTLVAVTGSVPAWAHTDFVSLELQRASVSHF